MSEIQSFRLRTEQVFHCGHCGQVTKWQHRNIVVQYKDGKPTGKQFHICPKCNEKYYKKEIKEIKKSDITEEVKMALNPNADVLDIKSYLETWSTPK